MNSISPYGPYREADTSRVLAVQHFSKSIAYGLAFFHIFMCNEGNSLYSRQYKYLLLFWEKNTTLFITIINTDFGVSKKKSILHKVYLVILSTIIFLVIPSLNERVNLHPLFYGEFYYRSAVDSQPAQNVTRPPDPETP